MIKLNAKELRKGIGTNPSVILSPDEIGMKDLKRNEIYIILDDVLDTYNIGSIFRLADALAVKKIYLCGGTETPPNSRIKKASINTTEWVDWEYAPDCVGVIKKLKVKNEKLKVVAIEQSVQSIPYDQFNYTLPLALVVGNETVGVSKEVLQVCNAIVELPMFGVNISLNVMVSLGIVLYEVIERMKITE